MTTKTTPLTLEQVKKIAKKYPTPFVIYDKKAIVDNMQEFKEAFSWVNWFKNFYAVKACPNPTILKILKKKKSLENIKSFDKIEWIDWYLLVNPYYNKPTQTGLYLHFTTLADSTKRPVILYNIKWRTCVNVNTDTLLKIIQKSKNIVWVKEASWDLNQMEEVIEKTPENFAILSGDDSLTYDLIKMWWDWIISVASNSIPSEMKEFVDLCLIGDSKAKALNDKYNEFFNKIFIQTNPLPTKTYLANKWIIKEQFRLPMCKMDEKEKEEFLDFIKENNY